MKINFLTYLFAISLLLFSACSSEDIDALPDYTWEDEELDGPSATISPFTPGDVFTRSTYVYRSQKMVFGWQAGDLVGLYPTAKKNFGEDTNGLLDPSNDGTVKHPDYSADNIIWRTNPAQANQRRFGAAVSSTQSAQLFNNDSNFEWDDIVQWTAYFPYKNSQETYAERTFSFKNQWQEGMVDLSAYKNGKEGYGAGDNNPYYCKSEEMASKHLGAVDYLISPEMSWSGNRINFQLRHVGAVIRMYLKAPKENLIVTKLQLICDSKIFYEEGKFSLVSHPYKAGEEHYGVDLDRNSSGCQIKSVGKPTNNLTLNFYDDDQHQKAFCEYDPNDQYKRYLIAYIMTYPVEYDPLTDGNLFAYVTAYKKGDTSKKEYHFVSSPLAGVNMQSSHYYQLSSATHPDDGLYPIELTATLLPWQDIVGAGINTDLEK